MRNKVLLFLALQLKGTKEYLGVYIFQSLFIPIIITLLIFFSSGYTASSMTFIYFLSFTLTSVIPTIAQQISNDLLPDRRDLHASIFVSLDTLFYGRLTLPFVFLLPQIIIVSAILSDINILVASIVLYLFLSSVGMKCRLYIQDAHDGKYGRYNDLSDLHMCYPALLLSLSTILCSILPFN